MSSINFLSFDGVILFLLLLWNSVCLSAGTSSASSINIALEASFPAPPYLVELLETAAEENSTSYFPLLDSIAQGYFSQATTDRELYDAFLNLCSAEGHLPTPASIASFNFALSIHSTAPLIEAHYQYYDTSVEPSLARGHSGKAQDGACNVWVALAGKQYCSPALQKSQQPLATDVIDQLPFDRILSHGGKMSSGTDEDSSHVPEVILYADITDPTFAQFHSIIVKTAIDGVVRYRVRYRRPHFPVSEDAESADRKEKKLGITGFGVELSLKRTDYIVIDDRKSDKAEDAVDEDQIINDASEASGKPALSLEEVLAEEITDLKPLTASELSRLGLKTADFIMSSADPFDTLVKVSQDFPRYTSALAGWNVSRPLLREHRNNRNIFVPAGYNVLWINGKQVQDRNMNAFALLAEMRRERAFVSAIQSLGFNGTGAVSMLSHTAVVKATSDGDEEAVQRYDTRDDLEGGRAIIWWNDLTTDARYQYWDSANDGLKVRMWPGSLPQIRQNIHNVVVPLDFSSSEDLLVATLTFRNLVSRAMPIRFGIVPLQHNSSAQMQARIAYYLHWTYGLAALISYLELCHDGVKGADKAHFLDAIKDRTTQDNRPMVEYETIVSETNESETTHDWDSTPSGKAYLHRVGAENVPGPYFANGAAMPRGQNWLQSMGPRLENDYHTLRGRYFKQEIDSSTDLSTYFFVEAAASRNAMIVPDNEADIHIIDMLGFVDNFADHMLKLPAIRPDHSQTRPEAISVHFLVVTDIGTIEGRDFLRGALSLRQEQPALSLFIVHNPTDDKEHAPVAVALTLQALANPKMKYSEIVAILDAEPTAHHSHAEIKRAEFQWEKSRAMVESLGLSPGEQGTMLNGRVVGPVPASAPFTPGDFRFLLQFEYMRRITPAQIAVKSLDARLLLESSFDSAILTSTVALSARSDLPEGIFEDVSTSRMNQYNEWAAQHTLIERGNMETASVHIVASIDPANSVSQRWVAILKVLAELDGVYLRLFLNPKDHLQELPIKRFYRQVLAPKPVFAADGSLTSALASFKGVPKQALLNVAMDVPPSWLVAAKTSIHDMDNIKLSALKEGANVDAMYELESILIEGHSRDMTSGEPPRGAQVILGTDKNPHYADTIIMANLGYFQFKANPGLWKLSLQAGRSSEIFTIDSAGLQGYKTVVNDDSLAITITSFLGRTLYPRLSRKPGKEDEDVLQQRLPSGLVGLFTQAVATNVIVNRARDAVNGYLARTGLSLSLRGSTALVEKHADINIFSVASGHLYERMLSIMMVSVKRHTNHTVKFWFLEQFLSPSFKETLPTLAAHYDFSYELITYKWPHWLRAQTEKQREIWGYKILFLDVLFPLSLKRVIFVDADQIVRTDMYELATLPLPEDTPYAFTPMCDSRTEMEGFRFWKGGYWGDYLRGKPYHISALYVVDLVKFRALAAGDRLRGQYHQLSADPNSLSNLDQDLPNHMQHSLPIHSLDQDWLWCETWCSDKALETAKTIDLCNNPLTKEPKLKRARRQIPEWTAYDDEIAGVLAAAAGVGLDGGARGEIQEQALKDADRSPEEKEADAKAAAEAAADAEVERGRIEDEAAEKQRQRAEAEEVKEGLQQQNADEAAGLQSQQAAKAEAERKVREEEQRLAEVEREKAKDEL